MMKKIIAALFIVASLTSCLSVENTPPPNFTSTITSENDTGLAEIAITTEWQSKSFFAWAEGISGFELNVKNNSDKIIKLVWESSSLSYNGNSYTPFITGQKYIEASRPMNATVIPAKGNFNIDLFSSGQPYYSCGTYGSGWMMNPINSPSVIILLCIQSGTAEDYYTITVTKQ
jgi:hypothetical protein